MNKHEDKGIFRVAYIRADERRMSKDTQAQEKRDSGHPDAGTGQSESKPN